MNVKRKGCSGTEWFKRQSHLGRTFPPKKIKKHRVKNSEIHSEGEESLRNGSKLYWPTLGREGRLAWGDSPLSLCGWGVLGGEKVGGLGWPPAGL